MNFKEVAKISVKEGVFGFILGCLAGMLLVLAIGCTPPSDVKKSYGEWRPTKAMVLEHSIIEDKPHTSLIRFDGKKVYIKCDDCKTGQILNIEYREVWTTICENNRCTLETNYQVRVK